jgi:hypothetical protein
VESDVFGKRMIVERTTNGWAGFSPYEEGKRRHIPGIRIPPDIAERELARYLADLCHEDASPAYPDVRRLDDGPAA